ncbi:hypothetical protein MTO96_035396 [Rhipicephalus appendiculatus]
MQAPDLPSGEFSSSQPECAGSSALLQPETVAATSEQPSVTQPSTPVIFVSELPTWLLQRCAFGHLRLRTCRDHHLSRAAKTQSNVTCGKSC